MRGGKRPGAGRPKGAKGKLKIKKPPLDIGTESDPKEFLRRIMLNGDIALEHRLKAAATLLPYYYPRQGALPPPPTPMAATVVVKWKGEPEYEPWNSPADDGAATAAIGAD